MAGSDYFPAVDAHYGRPDLGQLILETLRSQGKDLDALTADDIAPLTHLTGRFKVATVALGRLVGLQPGLHVLDLGSGLGGPARTLATEFGCRVTGLDLTVAFVRAATMLTARVGLADQVAFQCGNALELPFDDASFDVVWHEQFAMHVEDKERLYGGIHRVLRPGGRLAMREFLAGTVEPLHFPVPWTRDGSNSFLWPMGALQDLLSRLGFAKQAWEDMTNQEIQARSAAVSQGVGGAPITGGLLLQRAVGSEFGEVMRNTVRNYAQNRLRL